MAKSPFFSIIIPAYNRGKLLKIALNSVFAQTFSDYEVIIVDDGSTDGTKEIVSAAKRKNLSYVYQENQGPAAARNRGLKAARGRFVCFLDSDDRFCREKLKITRGYIKRYPQYKIFHSEEVWYRNGRLLPQKKYHQKPQGACFPRALKLCCLSISTAAIQKRLFDRVGNFDVNLPAGEDYDFWLRATCRYPVLLIPEYLTIKEGGHADQQSKKYPAMDKFRIYALKKLLESKALNKKYYGLAYAELKNKCSVYMQGALKRGRIKEVEDHKALLKKLKPCGKT